MGAQENIEQELRQCEWNSEHFIKLRRLKEEFSKPESVLDVALGRTEAYRELLHLEQQRRDGSMRRLGELEAVMRAVADCLSAGSVKVATTIARRAAGLAPLAEDDENGKEELEAEEEEA